MNSDGQDPLPPHVFVSSPSGELRSAWGIVKQALVGEGCFLVEQIGYPPEYREAAEMLEIQIGACDAVIHLVGLRYGAEPDPETLPLGVIRRSYAEIEADIARKLGVELHVFVCAEDFPFDPPEAESTEKTALQRSYREELAKNPGLHPLVPDRAELARRVRDVRVTRQEIRKPLPRPRWRRAAVVCVCVLLAAGLAGLVAGRRETATPAPELIEPKAHHAIASCDPVRIRANLVRDVEQGVSGEISRLDRVRDWEKIGELEKMRERQEADVDCFVDRISEAFVEGEASATYATASRLLGEDGVNAALRFLEGRRGARKAGADSPRRAGDTRENAARKALREEMLTALLLETNLRTDEAEALYRGVLRASRNWAGPTNQLAWSLVRRGESHGSAAANDVLQEAVMLCYGTLATTSRENFPRDWAMAQNDLGIALETLGAEARGEDGQRLLKDAVTAHSFALGVRTREQTPDAWASTENDLGGALALQSERAGGEEGLRLLADSVKAYRNALEVRTRERTPRLWAATQEGLGDALSKQGKLAPGEDGRRLLGEAAEAYRGALQIRTREESPLVWASTQHRLANVLRDQAAGASNDDGSRLSTAAVRAYRSALEVYSFEAFPQSWAATQVNLGDALSRQSSMTNGEDGRRLLSEAVQAYRAALGIFLREQAPEAWAMTENNLGSALFYAGRRAGGDESRRLLSEAVQAFRSALQVHTREQAPQDWARTQKNLRLALEELSTRVDRIEAKRLRADADRIVRETDSP